MTATGNIFRSIAGFLAMLFIVFSVGLPIVIASCPMAKDPQRATCDQCVPAAGRQSPSFVRLVDRSCCATVIAAGRNTTEYVRSGNEQAPALPFNLILPSSGHTFFAPATVCFAAPDTGPVHALREDIPIFVSSLLI